MNIIIDYLGRVTATGITGTLQKKNPADGRWVNVAAPTVAGTCIDTRPCWNWIRGGAGTASYTVNCLAVAVQCYLQVLEGGDFVNDLNGSFSVAVDSVPVPDGQFWDKFAPGSGDTGGAPQLIYGKRFNSYGSHTVTIGYDGTDYTLESLIDGYLYSDFFAELGTEIIYRDTADNVEHPITLGIDQTASLAAAVDVVVGTYQETGPFEQYHDWQLNTLSALYRLTADARLKTAADLVFDVHLLQCDANMVPVANVINPTMLLTAGRYGMAWYQAWKAFGDAKYLTACCKIVSYFLTGWPCITGSSTILRDQLAVDAAIAWNQHSKMLGVCTLAYNTPLSDLTAVGYASLYHNAGLYTLIKDNLDFTIGASRIDADGRVSYTDSIPREDDRDYAAFELADLLLASALCATDLPTRRTQVLKVLDWYNVLPVDEPFYFYGIMHSVSNTSPKRTIPYLLAGGALTDAQKKRLHLMSTDLGLCLATDDFSWSLVPGTDPATYTTSSALSLEIGLFSEMAAESLGIEVFPTVPPLQSFKSRRIAGKRVRGATVRTG